jgi:hypothetical protein
MKKSIILLAFALCLTGFSYAQDGPGFDDDVQDTPLDGGISLLVAAGAALGYKKYKTISKMDKPSI